MELFSGQSAEPSLADVVGEVAQLVMEKIYEGGKNFPPPPVKEGKSVTNKTPLSSNAATGWLPFGHESIGHESLTTLEQWKASRHRSLWLVVSN